MERENMKKKPKKSKQTETDMPELVTVIAKLVERLDILDKKTDQVISRVANLPSQMTHVFQDLQRSTPPPPTQSSQRPDQGANARRERIMYKAVCADCRKNCEVPFRPTEERPVYCKECFVIRKAGHVPQDPTQRIKDLQPPKQIMPVLHAKAKPIALSKRAGSAKKKNTVSVRKKKK
jgi:CxxC-x17-CxxC domain-containing protein